MTTEKTQNKVLIISYGEIALKKGMRHIFEKKLIENLQKALRKKKYKSITKIRGRIKIILLPEADVDELADLATKVFGVVAVHKGEQVETNWELIKSKVSELVKAHPFQAIQKSFGIRPIRSWKEFPLISEQIGKELGSIASEAAPEWHVDLSSPEVEIIVEVHMEGTYISTVKLPGPKGLPVGTAGKLGLLLSGGLDSPVAGHLMQKRGAKLVGFYFHSFPYTGDQALNKVRDLASVLKKRQYDMSLYVIHLTEIQEAIRDHCNPKYSVLLTRRFMMRLAELYAARKRCKGLVTGESLGQVASQTLENMNAVGHATKAQIYRPLISFDKTEIIDIARDMGTYDISIRPYEDCCSLFVDPHPITKADLHAVLAEEEKLDVEKLFLAALKKTKRFDVTDDFQDETDSSCDTKEKA